MLALEPVEDPLRENRSHAVAVVPVVTVFDAVAGHAEFAVTAHVRLDVDRRQVQPARCVEFIINGASVEPNGGKLWVTFKCFLHNANEGIGDGGRSRNRADKRHLSAYHSSPWEAPTKVAHAVARRRRQIRESAYKS